MMPRPQHLAARSAIATSGGASLADRNPAQEPGCFVAGTLVHTQEGLRPIEQIKVGDLVLSKHNSGTGKRAYKRVLKTFAHAP